MSFYLMEISLQLIKTILISFQISIDNRLWYCVSRGQMEINIRSYMNLCRQTKDFFFRMLCFYLIWSCNEVLLHISLSSCFSSGYVLESVNTYTDSTAYFTLFKVLSRHIVLAIFSCLCFYILINGWSSAEPVEIQ